MASADRPFCIGVGTVQDILGAWQALLPAKYSHIREIAAFCAARAVPFAQRASELPPLGARGNWAAAQPTNAAAAQKGQKRASPFSKSRWSASAFSCSRRSADKRTLNSPPEVQSKPKR